MSLSAFEIGLVVKVLERDLVGGIVRQVLTPTLPNRIVLEIWAGGKNHYLQLVIKTAHCRVGRIPTKPKRAKVPHPFVMLLRREFGGMMIQSVTQMEQDRGIRIAGVSESGAGALIAELTSKHSNLFWVGENDVIGGSFSVNRSHKRPLVPGEPYTPPIPHAPNNVEGTLRFAEEKSIESRIESFYRDKEDRESAEQRRIQLKRAIRTAQKRLIRLQSNLAQDSKRANQWERLSLFGHLLKANLHRIKKGQSTLCTHDFEGAEITIPLDPKRGPVANMEHVFQKSKRLMGAVKRIEKRQKDTEGFLAIVDRFGDELDRADSDRLTQMERELSTRYPGLIKKHSSKRVEKPTRSPFKEIPISAGRTARVGRSARDNDVLTLRHAKPDDLWLHIRGRTGSHVVVPMGRGEDPSEDILIDAAHLAAHFSDARGDSDAEVIYTRRRFVQKPKGAAPGSVRLLKEKTIHLRVDSNRLKELLGSASNG